ncbi:MAG: gamma-glutamyltransferase [Thalassobaculaceae bacterium]|nr:gamma-glutamyltransferase [Thalassobaculaceae bacterium]
MVLALVVATGLLSACGSDTIDLSEGFFGTVVAEEPRAALLARDVLVDGGSAADAVVTTFFALTATLPSSVGVTASGSCVVHDPKTKSFQRLDFLPRPSSDAANATTLPLAPRAMFALHARHGIKPLSELIIQGERIARFGEPVSRAFARELADDGAAVANDPAAAALYRPGGTPLAQGTALTQVELAATLARLRSEGVGTLHSGALARAFVTGAEAAGYTVDADRLRDALPTWSPVTDIEYDNHFWGLAAPTRADIRLGQAALGMILEEGGWASGDDGDRAHLLAEALNQATLLAGSDAPITPEALEQSMARFSSDRRGLAPPLPRLAASVGTNAGRRAGATSFFAVDRTGLAIGCAVGLGAPFGTGKLIPGLGTFVAPVQAEAANGPGAFALVVGNVNTGQFHMAASGAGGRRALSAVIETTLDHWVRQVQIQDVTSQPRSHYAGGANTVFVEPGTAASATEGLRRRGYEVAPADAIGTASAFRCVEGLPRREIHCGVAKDPRSTGLMFFEYGG